MKAILRPISHPSLGDIVLEDGVLPIGRAEAPFQDHDTEVVARLSRRHARIFLEHDIIYLAELGSLNGTQVNGRTVTDKPVKLQPGDEICFAGELTYRIELRDGTPAGTRIASTPIRLTLTPEIDDPRLETIVVTRFPFLIGKNDHAFARYKDVFPDEITYLSRRHALIFQKGPDLHIEDLDSTNGTFVSKARLDEHAKLLHDGDAIGFGGVDFFAYKVSLEKPGAQPETKAAPPDPIPEAKQAPEPQKEEAPRPAPQSPQPQRSAPQSAEPQGPEPQSSEPQSPEPKEDKSKVSKQKGRTTFITTADSFLDIFCADDSDASLDETAIAKKDPSTPSDDASAKKPARPGRIRRFGRAARELKGAFADEKPKRRGRFVWAAGVLLLISGALSALYMRGATEREFEALMDQGQYLEATKQTHQYLADHPDNAGVRELATEALLKFFVPEWQAKLETQTFDEASAALERAGDVSQANEDGAKAIEVMKWIADLRTFMAGRESDDSLVIFRDEELVESLLERWDADAEGHRRQLSAIARYVPAFGAIQSKAFSDLRLLRSQRAVSMVAMESLKDTIRSKLDTDNAQQLEVVFKEFATKYPKVDGMERLGDDLNHFLEIHRQTREKNPVKLAELIDRTEFLTPLFRDKVEELSKESLPPADVMREYKEAATAWRSGESARAISILELLVSKPWGEVATQMLGRYGTVLSDFNVLVSAPESEDYDKRLVAFYGSLDEDEDAYFLRSVEPDFEAHKEKVLGQAEGALEQAQQLWQQYQAKGGIDGKLRLEARTSSRFKKQAGLLSQAYDNADRGSRVYEFLSADFPAVWRVLFDSIVAETTRQRRALNELSMVLDPSLVEAKLELLAQPKEVTP